MITTNAGGGDYQGLPTTAIKHRGRTLPEGLPWAEINADYVASGGQVDAGVWGRTEKVRVIESGRRGSDRVHTFAEREGYVEPAAPKVKRGARHRKPVPPDSKPATAAAAKPRTTLTDAQRAEIAKRYVAGESMNALAAAFGVGIGSIAWAMKVHGVKSRTPVAAAALRYGKGES